MKRFVYVWVTGLLLTGMLAVTAGAQTDSLGDYARTVRKEKEKQPASAKKFDNDNLPKNDALSVVGNAPDQPAASSAASAEANPGDQSQAGSPEKAEEKPATAADEQKKNDQWKQKISAQKDQIDMLSRELDVLQREYRLRAAAFYADAGDRLRNSGTWDKQDAQYKQQIADKQKALDTAKQQLSDAQEEARKAGVPSSARE